jgi:hypothetical protein
MILILIREGTLARKPDQCSIPFAILVPFMVMQICKIGKIEARGDLFERMHDSSPDARAPDLRSPSTP